MSPGRLSEQGHPRQRKHGRARGVQQAGKFPAVGPAVWVAAKTTPRGMSQDCGHETHACLERRHGAPPWQLPRRKRKETSPTMRAAGQTPAPRRGALAKNIAAAPMRRASCRQGRPCCDGNATTQALRTPNAPTARYTQRAARGNAQPPGAMPATSRAGDPRGISCSSAPTPAWFPPVCKRVQLRVAARMRVDAI